MFGKIIIGLLILTAIIIQDSESSRRSKYAKKTKKSIEPIVSDNDQPTTSNLSKKCSKCTETIESLKKQIESSAISEDEFKNSTTASITKILNEIPDELKYTFLSGVTSVLTSYLPPHYAAITKTAIDLLTLKFMRRNVKNKFMTDGQQKYDKILNNLNNDTEASITTTETENNPILRPIVLTLRKVPTEMHLMYLNGIIYVLGQVLPAPIDNAVTMVIDKLKVHISQNAAEKYKKVLEKNLNRPSTPENADEERIKKVSSWKLVRELSRRVTE